MSIKCDFNNCIAVSHQPMWVCGGTCGRSFHMKCIGLNGPVLDKLKRTDQGSLQWFCDDCKKLSKSILCGHLKRLQTEFAKLQKQFASVSKSLASISEDFTKIIDCSEEVSDNNITISGGPQNNSTICTIAESDASAFVSPRRFSVASDSLLDNFSTSKIIATNSFSEVLTSQIISPKKKKSNIKENSAPLISNSDRSSNKSESKSSYTLQTIPPPKPIFISRFTPQTTSENVVDYIKKKSSTKSIIKCVKISKASSPVSSFKIIAPPNISETLLSENFWPNNTFVKIFKNYKPQWKKTAHLPKN